MKKGFTLIELLAVIVILAIISLIATPIILDVVDDSKKQAYIESVHGIINGAKYYYAESMFDENKSIKVDGKTNILNEISSNINGEKPKSGNVYINENGKIAVALVYGLKCYIKDFNSNDIKISKDTKECKVEDEPKNYICKRASSLHTEICENSFCTANYKNGDVITFGNISTNALTPGDAFDCDVNGDGVYDSNTERFYYVSDLNENTDYAVLIYYSNTTKGEPDSSTTGIIGYNYPNYAGPKVAIANLPTTDKWSNAKLYSSNRQIVNELGTSLVGSTNIPIFSYDGYSSRLLTIEELNNACKISVGSSANGELDSCEFLMENTTYSNANKTIGYWLENPHSASDYAWYVNGTYRFVYINPPMKPDFLGTRPVIEVEKNNIEI